MLPGTSSTKLAKGGQYNGAFENTNYSDEEENEEDAVDPYGNGFDDFLSNNKGGPAIAGVTDGTNSQEVSVDDDGNVIIKKTNTKSVDVDNDGKDGKDGKDDAWENFGKGGDDDDGGGDDDDKGDGVAKSIKKFYKENKTIVQVSGGVLAVLVGLLVFKSVLGGGGGGGGGYYYEDDYPSYAPHRRRHRRHARHHHVRHHHRRDDNDDDLFYDDY
jgi:hypothetical protein